METPGQQLAAFMIALLLMAGAIITGWLGVNDTDNMYREPEPRPATTTEYIDV